MVASGRMTIVADRADVWPLDEQHVATSARTATQTKRHLIGDHYWRNSTASTNTDRQLGRGRSECNDVVRGQGRCVTSGGGGSVWASSRDLRRSRRAAPESLGIIRGREPIRFLLSDRGASVLGRPRQQESPRERRHR